MPYKDSWLGGDVGSSIKLPNGKTFWIFGDSFIGEGKTRVGSHFINNSIAISSCSRDSFDISYHWSHKELKPSSYFENPRAEEFYWPLSAAFVKDTIIVALLRVRYDKNSPLGFSEEGVDLVRIKNWNDLPSNWKKDYVSLSDRKDVFPASELIVDGNFFYIFSYRSGGPLFQENVLSRLNVSDLLNKSDLRNDLVYLTKDHAYESYDPAKAKVVVPLGNTEFSIKKVGSEWILAQMRRNKILNSLGPDQIVISRSSSLSGPWSDEEILFNVPETLPSHPRYQGQNFCYAAKIHEDFRISYVCNSYDLNLIYSKMDIYTPIFIKSYKLAL